MRHVLVLLKALMSMRGERTHTLWQRRILHFGFDEQGNTKAFRMRDEWHDRLHVLCIVCKTTFPFNRQEGAIGKKHIKMKKIFTLRLMLISLFAAMSMAMNARIIDYNTDDGFKYKLNTEEKTATLSRYSGSAKEVCIPDRITYSEETFTVTYLGNSCFYNCTSLTSINIPSSVTSSGAGCFSACI